MSQNAAWNFTAPSSCDFLWLGSSWSGIDLLILTLPLWRQNRRRNSGWEFMRGLHRGKQRASNTFIPEDWSPRMRQLWVEEHRISHEIYTFRAWSMPSQCLFGHSDLHKTKCKMATSLDRVHHIPIRIRFTYRTVFFSLFHTAWCNNKNTPRFVHRISLVGFSPCTVTISLIRIN
jgi:hypothetical protein